MTYSQLNADVSSAVTRLLDSVDGSPNRWAELLQVVPSLSEQDAQRAISQLRATSFDPDNEQSLGLWKALRRVISHHWEFPDADWAMDDEAVEALYGVYERLTPSNPTDRYSWLYSNSVDLPSREQGSDFESQNATLLAHRQAAAREVVAMGGVSAAVRLVEAVDIPWYVGRAMIGDDADVWEQFLLMTLASSNTSHAEAAQGLLAGVASELGDGAIHDLLRKDWSDDQRGVLYASLPFDGTTWTLLDVEADQVNRKYWSVAGPYGRGALTSELVDVAVSQYLKWSEIAHAVRLVTLYPQGLSPGKILSVLQALVERPPTTPAEIRELSHGIVDLVELVAEADDVDEIDVARVEWALLPLLTQVRFGYRPHRLDRLMSQDPEFFIWVLSQVYQTDGDEAEVTADQRARASVSYALLSNWADLPGAAGTRVDAQELDTWVDAVRALAAAAGIAPVADVHIGHVLAFSPDGTDELWPHEAVRDLLENLRSEDVESGFFIQILNNRGATTRSFGEGGDQERSLSMKYSAWSDSLRSIWPRTSAALRRVAQSFENDAIRMDEQAQQDMHRFT